MLNKVKGLGNLTPEVTTKVHLSTVQATVRRCLYPDDADKSAATVDQYDCMFQVGCVERRSWRWLPVEGVVRPWIASW